jgi:hypothetical protein
MAAHFSLTNVRPLRGLRSCRARVTLTVPVSPRMSTVDSVGATVSTCFRMGAQRRVLNDDVAEVMLGANLLFQIRLLIPIAAGRTTRSLLSGYLSWFWIDTT